MDVDKTLLWNAEQNKHAMYSTLKSLDDVVVKLKGIIEFSDHNLVLVLPNNKSYDAIVVQKGVDSLDIDLLKNSNVTYDGAVVVYLSSFAAEAIRRSVHICI